LSELSDIETAERQICVKCGALIAKEHRFCKSCGARQSAEKPEESDNKWALFKQVAFFYSIYIGVCGLVSFTHIFNTILLFVSVEVVLAGTAVAFFAYNWAENKKLLVWRNFSWQKLAAYGAIAVAGSFLVHYSVGWLNVTIFSRDEQYYSIFAGTKGAAFYIVFFTAVTPALFEELAFRGYLLQTLLKIADTEQAVYVSAFLFAIIHLSFISLFWLIPFALFIGFVRIKENTFWYGVFFHFCFNLTGCLFAWL